MAREVGSCRAGRSVSGKRRTSASPCESWSCPRTRSPWARCVTSSGCIATDRGGQSCYGTMSRAPGARRHRADPVDAAWSSRAGDPRLQPVGHIETSTPMDITTGKLIGSLRRRRAIEFKQVRRESSERAWQPQRPRRAGQSSAHGPSDSTVAGSALSVRPHVRQPRRHRRTSSSASSPN